MNDQTKTRGESAGTIEASAGILGKSAGNLGTSAGTCEETLGEPALGTNLVTQRAPSGTNVTLRASADTGVTSVSTIEEVF